MSIELTFEKSAAPDILEAFPKIEKKCGICGIKVTAKNLGGVINLDNRASLICDKPICILGWQNRKVCPVCFKPLPCPCGGDRKKYAEMIAKSYMEDLAPMDDR